MVLMMKRHRYRYIKYLISMLYLGATNKQIFTVIQNHIGCNCPQTSDSFCGVKR